MIILAVLLRAKQCIDLRGHRSQGSSNDAEKNFYSERTMQRRKFLELVNAFAALDTVLMEHLEKCAKNTKAVPWQIQNDKIEFLS